MKHVVPVEALTLRYNLRYLDTLRNLARKNRVRSTRTEDVLWYEVLNKRKLGHKFTRQKPIGRFVADFYCSELLMIIEVDGGSHIKKRQYDIERDKYFGILNIKTVRVRSNDLIKNLNEVRNNLKLVINERELLFKSSPSSRGGGRRPEGF
jgi:very-short-patch-repair endonuclease